MYVKACHSSWKKRAEQHLQETILKGATWLAYIFAPSLHAGNFMCPTGFYHSSLVGQCHIIQHNWPLINLFHTPFWWPPKLLPQNLPRFEKSLNLPSATFETKKWRHFCQQKNAKVQSAKKLRLSSGVMSLTAPKKKINDRLDASPGDGRFTLGYLSKVKALESLFILETWNDMFAWNRGILYNIKSWILIMPRYNQSKR